MKITTIKSNLIKKDAIKIEFDEKIALNRYDGHTLTIKIDKIKDTGLYNFRLLLRSVVRSAQSNNIRKILIYFDALYVMAQKADINNNITDGEFGEMLAYEFELANYNFNKYKKEPKDGFPEVKELFVLKNNLSALIKVGFKNGQDIAMLVNNARNVSNTPAQDMTPKKLSEITIKEAKKLKNVSVKILNKEQIKKEKMGAFLGVAQGAAREPQFIIINYTGGTSSENPFVILGKAITYDTGGLGLKPAAGMVDMHLDMTGGAIAIYSLFAIAKIGLKKNVIVIVPATENAIGKDAYRNGDILTSMSGKTIEVRHTDAEGRLILADALTYAQKHYKPKAIVDIATLTGAAVMTIGQYASLIFTNNHRSTLPGIARISGAETGNRVWQMPIWDVYKKHMESKVADLSNISNCAGGGAITAAAFLGEFLNKDQDWMHIDISPRMKSVKGDNLAHGATGEPIYLLTKLIQNYIQ